MTFDLLDKTADIGLPSIYKIYFAQKPLKPIQLRYRMGTPYGRSMKMYTNGLGHITKMAIILSKIDENRCKQTQASLP